MHTNIKYFWTYPVLLLIGKLLSQVPLLLSYLAHFLIVVVFKIQVISGGHLVSSVIIVIRIWEQKNNSNSLISFCYLRYM